MKLILKERQDQIVEANRDPRQKGHLDQRPWAGNGSEQRPACGGWCLERRAMKGEVGVSIRRVWS